MDKTPRILHGKPALVLAPMEGVTDAPMRAFMSERGGFTFCVSEFLRISQDLQPPRTFFEHVPELKTDCVTSHGLPVQIQLLGGDPVKLALAAERAVALGARAIDLNFGCPAPTVNKHDGGATLLKFPPRLEEIVKTVRARLPSSVPLSAKLRLGWDNMDAIYENAKRAQDGGAEWITIHGRTKFDGYKPPAYWEPIGKVRQLLKIPVVANGEIWTIEDFRRCRQETGCEHFMLGRGALVDPTLPHQIANELGMSSPHPGQLEWSRFVTRFAQHCDGFNDYQPYTTHRIKQWLKMAHLRGKISWFDAIKTTQNVDELLGVLQRHEILDRRN